MTNPLACAIIKTIQEREVEDMMTLKEKVVVALLVVAFFGVCVGGNLLIDKLMVEPLMDKYTDPCIYTVQATVMEHTSNGCTLLEDEEGWLWMMRGQEIEVGTTGTLVMCNMDTPTDKYDDDIVDFY